MSNIRYAMLTLQMSGEGISKWSFGINPSHKSNSTKINQHDAQTNASKPLLIPLGSILLSVFNGRVCCSLAQSCLTLCNLMDCNTPGSPVLHSFLDFAQTQIHWVDDAIQPPCPLLPTSLPAFNLSQYQGLIQWVSSLHQVAKILELQLQHQSFQWIFRVDFL